MRKCINNALENEIAQIVKEVEQEKIEENVYSRPVGIYQRRGSFNGGLGDIHNMTSSLVSDGVLEVQNNTKVNPLTKPDGSYYNNAFPSEYRLAEIVEFGNAGHSIIHNPPRNFTQATINELKNTNKLSVAMRKGLKRQGLKTN